MQMQLKEARAKSDELEQAVNDHIRKQQEMRKIFDEKDSESQKFQQRIAEIDQVESIFL